MAVPTSYTDNTFGDYLEGELGPTATMLSWTRAGGDFAEPINDALNLLGESQVSDVSGATDIAKLRTLGKLTSWRRASGYMATDIDYSADGATFSRSKMLEHARTMVEALELEAAPLLAGGTIVRQRVDHVDDPYEMSTIEDREF